MNKDSFEGYVITMRPARKFAMMNRKYDYGMLETSTTLEEFGCDIVVITVRGQMSYDIIFRMPEEQKDFDEVLRRFPDVEVAN